MPKGIKGFQKGHKSFRKKGYKHTEETKKKMRQSNKHYWKDKKLTKKHKMKIKESNIYYWKDKKRPPPSKKIKRKISISLIGNKNSFKTGRTIAEGYILIHKPKHPFCTKRGYVFEHRLIVESQIGRYLRKEEVIHHINGIKDDNRPKNLIGFIFNHAHKRFHKNPDNVKSSEIIFDGRKFNKHEES